MNQTALWTGVADVIGAAERTGVLLGVAAISPEGERFSHNGGRRLVAASTVKIPIMIELFRRVDAGALSLDTSHALAAQDKAGGSGIVSQLHEGIVFTLRDLAYLMISISDNSATNILIDRLGMSEVNATMRALGMQHSTLGRKMRGSHGSTADEENWAVPDEYAMLIAALHQGRAASGPGCEQMLSLLEQQQNDRRIARHLSRDTRPRWGSKTGSLPNVVNDVGYVVTARGPFILAVFCAGVTDAHAGEQIIGDIAKAALEG